MRHGDPPPHSGYARVQVRARPSRRDVLKLGMVAAAGVVGLTGLSACAAVPEKPDQTKPQLRGGSYSHASTGGGLFTLPIGMRASTTDNRARSPRIEKRS